MPTKLPTARYTLQHLLLFPTPYQIVGQVMRALLLFIAVLFSTCCRSQSLVVTASDTSSERIKTAIHFLERYLGSFEKKKLPDFTQYWSVADCRRSTQPDDMLYTISWGVPTYRFCDRPALFFARDEGAYVHLKTLFATTDSSQNLQVWAITNHYITLNGQPRFISELELHKAHYRTVKNRNITYHFPSSTAFSYARSNQMLAQLKRIEQQWGFKPIDINYYFAANDIELSKMRGMDYNYVMDKTTPSGMTYSEQRAIFCQGLGEAYLHEVLHVYFNSLYEQLPMCHAMIYYLAGGTGKDFNWMIHRMNEYLRLYPETDLSQYESLVSKAPMLHIDYVAKGLLCKMMDKKDGIAGLKRAMQYKTVEELLEKEFCVTAATIDSFLKACFLRYEQQRSN